VKAALTVLWGGLCILYFQVYDFAALTYDDPKYLSQHAVADMPVMGISFWWTLFSSSSVNLWTPFTDLSHQLLFRVSKEPQLHLAFNVLLHGLNASLLLCILRHITSCRVVALGFSLLYAWHPVTVESVAWISGRKDLLCTFFVMLVVLDYLRRGKGKEKLSKGRILFFTIAACLSKPIGFTLPFLLLLLDYWPLRRDLMVQSGGTQSIDDNRTVVTRCFEALWALLRSVRSVIFPKDLHFVYSNPEYLSLGWIIAVTVIVGLIAGVLFWKKDQLRFVIVGALWYLLTLGPTLGLLRAGNNLAADRYTYLPLLGVVIGMAGLFSFLVTKKSKPVALGILFAIAVVISIVSFQQIGHWRSQEALFSNVIKNEPENVIARVELATLAHRMGEDDRAL